MNESAIAAAAAIAAPTIAVLVSHLVNKRRLNQIHVLVNSRLTEALDEIVDLKATLTIVRSEEGEDHT